MWELCIEIDGNPLYGESTKNKRTEARYSSQALCRASLITHLRSLYPYRIICDTVELKPLLEQTAGILKVC